ncbi:MAG: hypothetical protein JO291_05230 [Acidimicrobiia bacterium]|nr:hypothetical protein [Acidimicrobiia bacterium]
MQVGGPTPPRPPSAAAAAPPPWPPPPGATPPAGAPPSPWPPPGNRGGRTAATVVAAIAGAGLLVVIVCVGAVTLLGTDQHDSSAPSAGGPHVGPVVTSTEARSTTSPETSGDDGEDASRNVATHLGDAWELSAAEQLPKASTELCSPSGWNTGAVSRYHTVFDHHTGSTADGQVTINLTVYGHDADAAADLRRAESDEWYACQRTRLREQSGAETDPQFVQLPVDPQAPGVGYLERYRADGQAAAELIQYVFVGRARATITYCGCTTMGLEGRQQVAREVAAALAEAQELPIPGRGKS